MRATRRRAIVRSATRAGAVLNIILACAVLVSLVAGYTDLRWRRIPNWITVPAMVSGLALNGVYSGWMGLKVSLLGAGLGLLLLLPFVLLRSLGAGDWKLAGALGSFLGPGVMINVLVLSVFVAGLMAVALVIYKGRARQTIQNMGHLVASLATFRMPASEVSLDDPRSLKVPFGVALGMSVVFYGIARLSGKI